MTDESKILLFVANAQSPVEIAHVPLPGAFPGATIYIAHIDDYYLSAVDEDIDDQFYYWIKIKDMEEVPKHIKTYVMLIKG